jgi:hypothetical protein
MTSQINACRSGAFPTMAEEDEDESPRVNTEETDEEAQDLCLAFDDDLDSKVNNFIIEENDCIFMVMAGRSSPFCLCFEHSVRTPSKSVCQELKVEGL